MAKASLSSSGRTMGPTLVGTPSHHRATDTLSHSDWGNLDTSVTSRAHLWGAGGDQGTWRKATQVGRTRRLTGPSEFSPETGALARAQFFFRNCDNETT